MKTMYETTGSLLLRVRGELRDLNSEMPRLKKIVAERAGRNEDNKRDKKGQ